MPDTYQVRKSFISIGKPKAFTLALSKVSANSIASRFLKYSLTFLTSSGCSASANSAILS